MIGVAGCYLLYSSLTSYNASSKKIRRLGEILIGFYALASCYAVLQITEDREAFMKMIPFPKPVLFLYATLLGSVGLCYLPSLFIYDITVLLVVLVTFSTAVIDCRMTYWTKRRGLDYWNQFRLAADNLSIICGALLYLSSTRKIFVESAGRETTDKSD